MQILVTIYDIYDIFKNFRISISFDIRISFFRENRIPSPSNDRARDRPRSRYIVAKRFFRHAPQQ